MKIDGDLKKNGQWNPYPLKWQKVRYYVEKKSKIRYGITYEMPKKNFSEKHVPADSLQHFLGSIVALHTDFTSLLYARKDYSGSPYEISLKLLFFQKTLRNTVPLFHVFTKVFSSFFPKKKKKFFSDIPKKALGKWRPNLGIWTFLEFFFPLYALGISKKK